MKIIIHRGTAQIGGCVTELKTENARIFIDMGAELPGENTRDLPPIMGVTSGKADCDGVFITHYHGDHIGLYREILESIPIYIGEAAKEIFSAYCERMRDDRIDIVKAFHTYKALDRIKVKDILVTPILVDHSAFDAYMFLIESSGTRVLHTGDFRTHGFRGDKLFAVLEKYVGKIDVLITEGTLLSRNNEYVMSERELQMRAKELMKTNKYVFVLCSSTNIDRIAAFYHANPFGRYFICDKYQSDILKTVRKHAGYKSSLYNMEKIHTYGANLDERLKKQGFCMLVRSNDAFKKIMKKFGGGLLIYSMWEGYLKGNSRNNTISDFVKNYNYFCLHTSGHATSKAIRKLISSLDPKIIIPIHTESPKQFLEFIDQAYLADDGEVIDI